MFTIVTATNTYTVLTSHVLMCACSLYSSLYETFHSHWLGVVDWIDTPPHPKFICWSLMCNMLVQRGEAFGNYWGHQGGALMKGISALVKQTQLGLGCTLRNLGGGRSVKGTETKGSLVPATQWVGKNLWHYFIDKSVRLEFAGHVYIIPICIHFCCSVTKSCPTL